MSVSDPLIRELKGCVLKLLENVNPEAAFIDDENPNLHLFCGIIEKIFNKGLIVRYNSLGYQVLPEPWFWLENISKQDSINVPFNFTRSVEIVQENESVSTPLGRFRLLIRACLVHKCLHAPIQVLTQSGCAADLYETCGSILGDEILREILLSVLLQCSTFKFDLNLNNASFLDISWLLPDFVTLELVPCKSLGMSVIFAQGKAVVVTLKSSGVAAEGGKIEVGDILDELNGIHINNKTKGKLNKIMRGGTGRPVTLKIIKVRWKNSNDLYPPITPFLKQVDIDPDALRNKYESESSASNTRKVTSGGYQVTYIGHISTGCLGDVRQIDRAIRLILFSQNEDSFLGPRPVRFKKAALFEIGEMGVKVVDPERGEMILKHCYMEISSCGTVGFLSSHFAYIAASKDEAANGKSFTCHVFHCKNSQSVNTILLSIGQGFRRTHYAV